MVRKHSSVKQVILAVAIALVAVFFFVYAVQSFYPAPEYEDFCEKSDVPRMIENSEVLGGTCATVSPGFRDECCVNKGYESYNEDLLSCEGDVNRECGYEFDAVSDVYERNVFFINLALGILVLVVGFLLAIEAVSTGLMGGGVIMVVYGTIRYWGNLSNVWRTLVLGIALVILIWLGYKKLK